MFLYEFLLCLFFLIDHSNCKPNRLDNLDHIIKYCSILLQFAHVKFFVDHPNAPSALMVSNSFSRTCDIVVFFNARSTRKYSS